MPALARLGRLGRVERFPRSGSGRRRQHLVAERHYLQFDGVTTYAYADGVFADVASDYTLAIKVSQPMIDGGSAGGGGTYISSGGPAPNADAESAHDSVARVTAAGTTTYWIAYRPDTGAVLYSAAGAAASVGKKIIAVKRLAAGTAKRRVVDDSGVEYSSDVAAALAGYPDHIGVGARISNALGAHTQRGPVSMISAILASVEVPDAELLAWLTGGDARAHITGLVGYWVASDLVGSSIPARVGSVAMTLVGLDAGDLVSL